MTAVTAETSKRATGVRTLRPRGAAIDPLFGFMCGAAATLVLAALAGVMVSLAIGGAPAFAKFGFGFFTSTSWNPVTDVYGGAGPIVGTLITAFLALIFSLPIAVGVAVFLTEFCPRILRRPIGIAVELLAGVPSIVYGIWGLFVFAPVFAKLQGPIVNWAGEKVGDLDTLAATHPLTSGQHFMYGVYTFLSNATGNGSGILTAALILAIMILPFMAATLRELFLTVPAKVRESAYGVGCTPLEVVTSVTIPYVRRSAIGAVMLGLGRALGETMAVTFIIGNSHKFPDGLFAGGSTIASTIANEFAEADPGMHTAALIALGFVLFLITFTVLAIARALLGSQKQ